MKKKSLLLFGILVCAVISGFIQENLKVNINYILDVGDKLDGFHDQAPEVKKQWLDQVRIDAPYDYYHNHHRIDFLYRLSRKQLTLLKWTVTIFFVILFMLFNAQIMKWMTGERKYFVRTILLYVFFFSFAFIIYIIGYFTGTLSKAYGVSREITGGLQSLVPLMILLPAFWLNKNQHIFEKNENPK